MEVVARAGEEYGNTSLRLEGGTALAAYYLGHRESEDLDFFSDYGTDQQHFGEVVVSLAAGAGLVVEPAAGMRATHTFARFVARDSQDASKPGLKLDFAAQSPFRLAPLESTAEGIRVASFRDLAASKLHAICDRIEVRDFIDLHVILTNGAGDRQRLEDTIRTRTRDLVRDVIEIDPGLNARLVGEAISRGLDRPLLAGFPLALLIPLTEADLQETLRLATAECASLVAESLPSDD